MNPVWKQISNSVDTLVWARVWNRLDGGLVNRLLLHEGQIVSDQVDEIQEHILNEIKESIK